MRRLRQKVELDPNRPVHLETVRGVGYRLVPSTLDDERPSPASATPQGGFSATGDEGSLSPTTVADPDLAVEADESESPRRPDASDGG